MAHTQLELENLTNKTIDEAWERVVDFISKTYHKDSDGFYVLLNEQEGPASITVRVLLTDFGYEEQVLHVVDQTLKFDTSVNHTRANILTENDAYKILQTTDANFVETVESVVIRNMLRKAF